MLFIQNVWMFVADHGYGAFVEFIIDLGDHMVTHAFAMIVIKAGVVHVGFRIVKHARKRKNVKSTDLASD